MRWVFAAVVVAFCTFLAAAWMISRRADPKMIDADPVAVDKSRWHSIEQGKWQAHPNGLTTIQ